MIALGGEIGDVLAGEPALGAVVRNHIEPGVAQRMDLGGIVRDQLDFVIAKLLQNGRGEVEAPLVVIEA